MRLTVNGRAHELHAVPTATLLELLRDQLAFTGTKLVCDRGECGACTVQLDGDLAYSCLTLAVACDGASVLTIEGLAGAHADETPSPPAAPGTLAALQRAFSAHDAAQCGFCTPGQLIAAHHLLSHNAHPTDDEIREGMSGNLCRCGTYPAILVAIRAVASGALGTAGGGAPEPTRPAGSERGGTGAA
jgi:aerobic-type carbon monoxide dehydrogenase small subunit (CoxS/CutS family)